MKLWAAILVAIAAGLIIVTVVTLVIHFQLGVIVDTLFPSPPEPEPPEGTGLSMIRLSANFGIEITILVVSELLNGFIGSFIAQFLFRYLELVNSRMWQSSAIGFIVGVSSVYIQEVFRNRSIPLAVPLIYGLITASIGLLGYYMAGRIHRRRRVLR